MTGTEKMAAGLVLLVVALSACTTSDGVDVADVASQDAVETLCSALGEEECKASRSCSVIEGWPMPQACFVWQDTPPAVEPVFVSCALAGECSLAFTWARPEDAAEELWLFPSSCIPDGWVEVEAPPCGSE